MEDHLGQSLFLRQPRGLALTAAGASYLAEISRAFDGMTEATARLLARPEQVTISVTPTVAARLLIPKLAEFSAELPGIELRTIATEALSDFDRDQVDLAVRQTRAPLPASFETRLLFRQELIAVASPHLVSGRDLPLSVEDLRALPLLKDAHDNWRAFLDSPGPVGGATFNQTALALDAAMAGQGVALACRAFVVGDLAAGRLVQVMDRCRVIGPDYILLRKRSATPRKAAQAVWEWCAQHLAL
ncbi:transcriptional regulator, LysR family (plasmid) [Paracoccus aminophilus JCM 7686]|uniref:Transcriptional regulator, LysR family n=1 Tax=Paracoccus aminophilus JCM 7686 TaxID=1367847 RepID=S5Z190_PARAH|nr:transcriptional regulator, LysR family [Paracoccus aminophilus JCM 7686]